VDLSPEARIARLRRSLAVIFSPMERAMSKTKAALISSGFVPVPKPPTLRDRKVKGK
jgi:hypothetical protein